MDHRPHFILKVLLLDGVFLGCWSAQDVIEVVESHIGFAIFREQHQPLVDQRVYMVLMTTTIGLSMEKSGGDITFAYP